jgi:hypothetical protein
MEWGYARRILRRSPMSKVNAVPAGLHTITPQLSLEGAAEAIDFYRKAFGAEETMRRRSASGARTSS